MSKQNFEAFLRENSPVLGKEMYNSEGVAVDVFSIKNASNMNSFKLQNEIADKILSQVVDDEVLESEIPCNVLLVGDDDNQIRKAAAVTICRLNMLEEDIDDIPDESISGSGRNCPILAELDLKDSKPDIGGVSSNLLRETKFSVLTAGMGLKSALYSGLERENLKDQIEAIKCSARVHVFVAVPPNLLEEPEIQELIADRGFIAVRMYETDRAYFRDFYDRALEETGRAFESEELKDAVFNAMVRGSGDNLSEEGIISYLTKAEKTAGKTFQKSDFEAIFNLNLDDSYKKLRGLTGLENIKTFIEEQTAVRVLQKSNPSGRLSSGNLVFAGNPGTGKTTTAELFSDILTSEGISNGRFVTAARSAIIGSYVGHTAPKVEALFKKARGGILFVDEAGFLLNRNSGGFIDEAIKEFVRYMELYKDDVIVIFAMYMNEVEGFLALDEGLASRISEIVKFEDYSEEELRAITKSMILEKGFEASEDALDSAVKYLAEKKSRESRTFGNA